MSVTNSIEVIVINDQLWRIKKEYLMICHLLTCRPLCNRCYIRKRCKVIKIKTHPRVIYKKKNNVPNYRKAKKVTILCSFAFEIRTQNKSLKVLIKNLCVNASALNKAYQNSKPKKSNHSISERQRKLI